VKSRVGIHMRLRSLRAAPLDAQLVPEGAKWRDRRPSSDLDAMQRVSGTCTTGAVSSREIAGFGYDEAVTPL
jgi:hypothetical protein